MNLIFSLRRGLGRKEVKWAAFVLIFIWNKRVLILSFLLLSFEVTKPFIKKSRSFIMKISFAHHEINLDFWSKWRSIVFITLIWTSQKKKKKKWANRFIFSKIRIVMILQYTETENNECSDKTSSQHLPKCNFKSI